MMTSPTTTAPTPDAERERQRRIRTTEKIRQERADMLTRGVPTTLRLPQVLAMVGGSKSTLYTRIRDGKFPAPMRLGPRLSVWRSDEIAKWLDALPRADASPVSVPHARRCPSPPEAA